MVGKNILEHPSAAKHEFFAPDIPELNLFDFEAVKAGRTSSLISAAVGLTILKHKLS